MSIFYLDPTEEFVQPNDPIHQLFEYADDMCFLCANAVVCPGYSGSYYEPPEEAYVEGCNAGRRCGGTMPEYKIDEVLEDTPKKLCPWFAKKYLNEKA